MGFLEDLIGNVGLAVTSPISPENRSKLGQNFDLPVIFDDDTAAARQDVLQGATDSVTGDLKRSNTSSAYASLATTPTYEGSPYNAFGDVIDASKLPTDDSTDDKAGASANEIAANKAAAQKVAQAGKAQGIKNSLVGRGGEVDSILQDILSRITGVLEDKKKSRSIQYDGDSAALINSLNSAIPEIQKAFASLGLSSSTFVGDRVSDTNNEYEKSQEGVNTQFDNDIADYGKWATGEEGKAGASATKAKSNIDYVKGLDPTAENLSGLQQSQQTFNNALTDFGSQTSQFEGTGDALQKMNDIGSDYDFNGILNAFGGFAGNSANIGNGKAINRVKNAVAGVDEKTKKKLNEVQVNNPVGAATT